MKKVILILLLISNIYAQITQQDICQFKKVIKNGWTDDNQTLNQKIIDLGKVEIPQIITNLEYPLKPDDNISNIPPFPKRLVHFDDYTKLFAYSKYLESKHKITDIIELYLNAYRGLKNIKISSFLPFVHLIIINGSINKSLYSSLNHHIFSKKEKILLYNKLSSILILNNHKLIKAIEAERDILFYFVNSSKVDGDYSIDEQHLAIFIQLWKKAGTTYYLTFIAAIQNNTLEEFIAEKKKYRESVSIATHLKMKLLKLKLELYHKLSMSIKKEDYIILSTYMINKDLFINTKAIDSLTSDYFKVIEDNKKLLLKLKENQ